MLCVLCHETKPGMSAGSIVFAYYLAHDKILQPLGLWREEVRELFWLKPLPRYITYYIYIMPSCCSAESVTLFGTTANIWSRNSRSNIPSPLTLASVCLHSMPYDWLA